MPDSIANAIVYAGLVYFVIGLLFAIVFVARGAQQIDPAAATPSLLLRLLWIPGSAAFWPMLLRRWLQGAQPPTEVTAHRSATASERGTAR